MRIEFIVLIFLSTFLFGCSRSGDNMIGNYTQIDEDGSEWGILPEAEITNPDVMKILTDTIIPFLENNYRPSDYFFIEVFPVEEDNMIVFNAEKHSYFNLSVGHFDIVEEAYLYYNDYLILLTQRVDSNHKFFKAKANPNYQAFLSYPQEFRDNIVDDSIIFWYYDIDGDSLKLIDTNEFYQTRSKPARRSGRDAISVRKKKVIN